MDKEYTITITITSKHGRTIFKHSTWFWNGLTGTWFDLIDCFKNWIPQVIAEYEERKEQAKKDKYLLTARNEN